MKSKSMQNWELPPIWLRSFITILLVLGVFFRFVNLDRKVYWGDEVYTSIRISGHTTAELIQQVFDGQVHSVEELQKYQRINSQKGIFGTIKGLVVEEPQLSPLYFVMARFWVQWFGDSVAVTRSLSALISLLVFPCIYWLCQELFESSLVGWLSIGLLAVSPFHVLYAQEARLYSLWTVSILLSSAAILRAMRLNTKLSWIIYLATVVLGLYSYLLSGLITIGHGIYIVTTKGFQFSKTFTSYVLASFTGILTFTPWLWVFIDNFINTKLSSDTGNTKKTLFLTVDLFPSVKHWIGIFSRVFFDFNFSNSESFKGLIYLAILILFLLVLICYSIYFLFHKTSKRIYLFIIILIGFPASVLVLQELILSKSLSDTPARYLIPSYLGCQLAVAYLLAVKSLQQKLWQIIMIMLISSGVLSCILISQADAWWNKQYSSCNPPVARIINQAIYPLVISDADGGIFDSAASNVISLSYLLEPKVRLQLLSPLSRPKIPEGFSDIFLFTPSIELRNGLGKEQKYNIKPIYKAHKPYRGSNVCLWKLERVVN